MIKIEDIDFGKDGISFRNCPMDMVMTIRSVERLRESLPEKYRNDLIGIEPEGIHYKPCFATLQSEWDNELAEHNRRKGEFCRKYGCE